MKKITIQGIEYEKDTSYSDILYDANWTNGHDTVIVSGSTSDKGDGWSVKVNGVREIMNELTIWDNGSNIKGSEEQAFTLSKTIIEKIGADGGIHLVRINKKQEMELLKTFTEVLYEEDTPQSKYGTAISLDADGSLSICSVDHWEISSIQGFKIEDYEKVFEILKTN